MVAILAAVPVWVLWTAVGVLSSSAVLQLKKDDLNLWLMGVFRDVGRHKAYKRRFANSDGLSLLSVIMHQEDDPLFGISLDDADADSNVPTYTLQELWEFGNGRDEESPLLLSIFGRIYDVSEGEKFYGPDAPYGVLIGHDVTYALATGCKACATSTETTAKDLTDKQLKEGQRWLSFFQLHDKYPYVGKLDETPVEANMNEWIDADIAKEMKEEEEGNRAVDDSTVDKESEEKQPLKAPY